MSAFWSREVCREGPDLADSANSSSNFQQTSASGQSRPLAAGRERLFSGTSQNVTLVRWRLLREPDETAYDLARTIRAHPWFLRLQYSCPAHRPEDFRAWSLLVCLRWRSRPPSQRLSGG